MGLKLARLLQEISKANAENPASHKSIRKTALLNSDPLPVLTLSSSVSSKPVLLFFLF